VKVAREKAKPSSQKVGEEDGGPCKATRRDQKVRIKEVLEIKDGLLYRKGML